MPSPAVSSIHPAPVIQASFDPGKEPRAAKPAAAPAAAAPTRAPAATGRPPHPATVAQGKASPPSPAKRPPHPATVVQGKASPPSLARRPPHPATLPRGRAAQPALAAVSFPAPPGLLRFGMLARGKPLPETIQRSLGERFGGADFGTVRVHEGPEPASLGALALTAGEHLFFAPGQYRPETSSGRALLGKQLAYVLQQREGRVTNPFGSGVAVVRDPALEAEAAARAGLAQR